MSIKLANFKLAVYSRLAADEAAPDYSALNEGNITRWLNEKIGGVILSLEDSIHYQALIARRTSITLTSMAGNLPSDFLLGQKRKDLVVALGSSYRHAYICESVEEFERWDSSNWILTPTDEFAVACIADGKVHVKADTTYTVAYMDYVQKPTISSANHETSLSDVGDMLLIDQVVKEAQMWLQNLASVQ